MTISIIVAMAENNVIGHKQQLPWHLPHDLQHFKSTTLGKPIVMGRKTYEAIGRPLPGRRNIILSTQAEYAVDGVEVYPNIHTVLDTLHNAPEIMIIGGAQIYAAFLPHTTRLYITHVHTDIEGDTRFPTIDFNQWRCTSSKRHAADAQHAFDFTMAVYDQ